MLSLGLLSAAALAQTEPQSAAPAADPSAHTAEPPAEAAPATVVVEGRRPGPGVWKVSKDGHVMWVFALYSPLPYKMEWDASRVERLVAKSQEVLLPPGASIDVGFFRSLTLIPGLLKMKKNPDGAQLRDVLPPELYARWQPLKQQYLAKDDDVESYRPMYAAEELMAARQKKAGLSSSGEVRKAIENIAKQNKVKLTETKIELPVDDPRAMLKEFNKSKLEDTACFTKNLDSMETDVDAMRVRANAWANGKIAEIRSLDFTEREDACGDAVLNSDFAKKSPALQDVRGRIRAAWLQAAEKSLANNASTFAVVQMKDVFDQKGYLAALQAKGYTVENPK
jgi:hypothetical protein